MFNVCPKRFVVIHRQRLVSTQQNMINRGILMTFIRCVIRRKKKKQSCCPGSTPEGAVSVEFDVKKQHLDADVNQCLRR